MTIGKAHLLLFWSENAVEDEDEVIVLWILKWIKVWVILICYLGGWLHRPYKNLSEKWSQ